MKLSHNFLLLVALLVASPLLAQPGLQVGSGTGVGWMIYHRGLSQEPQPVSMGYDRTYVSLLIPIEVEAFWNLERLRIGMGLFRTLMFDKTMIATTDRRGDRERYRIAPSNDNLLFQGLTTYVSWLVNPGHRMALRPSIRLGTFRSNTIHPAWNILDRPLAFSPGADISWALNEWLYLWVCPQYVHLWKHDSPVSRKEERLDLYSIDIRAGIRVQWP